MKCASCHDSFIDRWKLNDAYGLASIFADKPLEAYRCDIPTGRIVAPAWVFPELGSVDPNVPKQQRLEQLAALMTAPDNGRFTRTFVNRLWHKFMGHGLVHPVDSMEIRPWNEDILDWMAVAFADVKYDVKAIVRGIVTSEAYQAVAVPYDPADNGDYVHRGMLAKRLTAEQFIDSIHEITSSWPIHANTSIARTVMPIGAPMPADLAKWIWVTADTATHRAGARVWFRKRFAVNFPIQSGHFAVSCDNECLVYLNGQLVATVDNFQIPQFANVDSLLKPGENEIIIRARNLGDVPNPAGMRLQLEALGSGGGESFVLPSDETWDVLPAPQEAEAPIPADAPWQKAQVVDSAAWGQTFVQSWPSVLTLARGGKEKPVRVSLTPADLFQRSLGRPNREQVVTVRPEELTTLEALDLSNGETLTQLLGKGATTLILEYKDPKLLLDRIFQHALARHPSPEEQAELLPLLGAPVQATGLEDVLWIVFMTPEFQLLR